MQLLHEPAFWVAVSFFIFVAATFKPLKKAILSGIDSHILKIKSELDQAIRLRKEAEQLLEKYKEKNKEAQKDAEAIIKNAEKHSEQIIAHAKKELENTVKKRTELATQRIAQAEAAALKEIKDNAVDITVSAAKSLIMENLTKEAAEELLHNALSEIERNYH